MKDVFQFLRDHPLFSNLNDNQISLLTTIAQTHSHEKDEVLFHEGDSALDIYFIIEGEVEVLKQDPKTQFFYQIVTLAEDAVLGEMSLVEDAPRGATVRALIKTDIVSLSIPALREFANDASDEVELIYYKLVEKIAHELCARLRLANESMVGSFSQATDIGSAHTFFTKMLSF